MGFFSKIFGGKKETGEIQTGSGEQPAVEDSPSQKPAPEAEQIPEEDRVPEPELEPEPAPQPQQQPQQQQQQQQQQQHREGKGKGKHKHKGKDSDHKPTVFGMAAPSFTQPAPETSEPPASSEGSSSSMVSGEMAAGEMEISSGSAEPAASQASGSMVVGGEVTLGQTSSGEIMMDEVSVAAPIVGGAVEVGGSSEAESAGEIAMEEYEEPRAAVHAMPAVPTAAAATTDSGRLSGSRPAILDDDDHADVELFPKAATKKDSRSTIDCVSCRHRLPVPYVGYPARITCPFCLNVNEYNM